MHYAYILQSRNHPARYYRGSSHDPKARLKAHNAGENPSTATFRPWKLVWYAGFRRQEESLAFERYLKSASGKAFTRKRLLPPDR